MHDKRAIHPAIGSAWERSIRQHIHMLFKVVTFLILSCLLSFLCFVLYPYIPSMSIGFVVFFKRQ